MVVPELAHHAECRHEIDARADIDVVAHIEAPIRVPYRLGKARADIEVETIGILRRRGPGQKKTRRTAG